MQCSCFICKTEISVIVFNFTATSLKNNLYNIPNILAVIKVPAQNQQLYYKDEVLDDSKTLVECGLGSTVARAQNPAAIGLALR